MLEIASEMQHQRAADIRDARYLSPEIPLVGVGFDLTPETAPSMVLFPAKSICGRIEHYEGAFKIYEGC